ncbi:MAG: TRAP transporter small permease [Candidatus Goldiibacteriota bacterium]
MKFLRRLNYSLYQAQKVAVVVFFLALLALSALQVILRLLFHSGIPNAETLMQYLVMWVAFLGASLAAYKGRHINLDVVSRSLKKLNKNLVKLIVGFVSTVILIFLLKASIEFVLNEMSDSQAVFFVPVWMLESIIPIMFLFMLLVYLQNFICAAAVMMKERKKK